MVICLDSVNLKFSEYMQARGRAEGYALHWSVGGDVEDQGRENYVLG